MIISRGGWTAWNGFEGKDCMVPSTNWSEMDLHKVDGFKFGFTKKLELLSGDFPEPALQLEFEGNVPWILQELPEPINP